MGHDFLLRDHLKNHGEHETKTLTGKSRRACCRFPTPA
jgi:hypothetical protein